MTVGEAKPGDIIETIIAGTTGGPLYKVSRQCPLINKTTARMQFTGRCVQLAPTNQCRRVDPRFVENLF